MTRLYANVTHEMLPRVEDRLAMLYFEHAKIDVDDSSIKIMMAEEGIMRVPVATISTLLLGPGVSITHEAIKIIGKSNCLVCWVSEDSMAFHSFGMSPTHSMVNARTQCKISVNTKMRQKVAQRMYSIRFPNDDFSGKTIQEMMGMEGIRVRNFYLDASKRYNLEWYGRKYTIGNGSSDDPLNRAITSCNHALYGIVTSAIHHLGYLPQIGFVHTSGSMPFSYDIADLYKTQVAVEAAFKAYEVNSKVYDRRYTMECFRGLVVENKVLSRISDDIKFCLKGLEEESNKDTHK
jgi:CRISPR-associated protein Cas1